MFVLLFSAETTKFLASVCTYWRHPSLDAFYHSLRQHSFLLIFSRYTYKLSHLSSTVYCQRFSWILTEPFTVTHLLHCNFKFLSFQLPSDISFPCLRCVDLPSVRPLRYSARPSLKSTNFSFILWGLAYCWRITINSFCLATYAILLKSTMKFHILCPARCTGVLISP